MDKQTQDTGSLKARIISPFEKFGAFLQEVKVELIKCSWPTRKELFGSSMVVIISVLILAVIVSFFDFVVLGALKLIIH